MLQRRAYPVLSTTSIGIGRVRPGRCGVDPATGDRRPAAGVFTATNALRLGMDAPAIRAVVHVVGTRAAVAGLCVGSRLLSSPPSSHGMSDNGRRGAPIANVYLKAGFYQKLVPPGVSSVFSVRDTDLHRRYRRLLSGGMSESSLKSMYPAIEANVNLAIQNMREEMEKRGAADVFKWWMFMATDIIGELTFGESFRMLEQKKKNQYSLDLENAPFIGALRATFPSFLYISKFLPLPVFKRAAAATMRHYRDAEESVARHRRLELADPTNVKATLFSKLYKAEDDEQLSLKETRDNALAYIVAGSDTTSNTLTYLVWAVCRHPHVKKALLNELASFLPSHGFGDQELKQLPYLNGVIDETLRIYGAAASALPRVVPPGGRLLLVAALAVTCIGVHLARMELRLAAAKFFRAFPEANISGLEGMSDEDMEPTMYFLLSPKGKRCLVQAY
ncbi:cytochrome P450 [Chaetomidium leptoderma]|uniref:Cytochrome P450 n=1 Tax=Chaetomidium leptoderma TaxID=669021 RepID=A0AAN6VR75_9PEZI|nr:cytochrome P450 [Chaetomidium leptoderma]